MVVLLVMRVMQAAAAVTDAVVEAACRGRCGGGRRGTCCRGRGQRGRGGRGR